MSKELIYRLDEGRQKWVITGEEIVRCRDCEYSTKAIEGYWCKEWLAETPMYDESVYVGGGDGFCSWGVRRDD